MHSNVASFSFEWSLNFALVLDVGFVGPFVIVVSGGVRSTRQEKLAVFPSRPSAVHRRDHEAMPAFGEDRQGLRARAVVPGAAVQLAHECRSCEWEHVKPNVTTACEAGPGVDVNFTLGLPLLFVHV